MTAYEIIEKKRDGYALTSQEIRFFVQNYLNGTIKDYQMSALLMAVCINGMNHGEIVALTRSYIDSGEVVDFSGLHTPAVDKHSTGGVGDKVSIILAPLAASLGIAVPMISGRGLGHTGGTLDKLESIPGFRTNLDLKTFKKQVESIGVAMIGQTDSIVPADRKIYALRDVTATVESIPLIVASIMSKKIAEGIQGLVLDIKFGNGAFMKEMKQAEALSKTMIQIGNDFGLKTTAYLTSMEQPLGYKIGNWLEIVECIDCLHGKGPEDILEVTLTLTAEMLVLGKKAPTLTEAKKMCKDALSNGCAYEKFKELVKQQGGDIRFIENPSQYPQARFHREIRFDRRGYIGSFKTREIGMANVLLGAGRMRAEDPVDYQSGIVLKKKIGDFVKPGDVVMEVFTNQTTNIELVERKLMDSVQWVSQPGHAPILIAKRISDMKTKLN